MWSTMSAAAQQVDWSVVSRAVVDIVAQIGGALIRVISR